MEKLPSIAKTRDIIAHKTYKKSNALINAKGHSSLLTQQLFAIGLQYMTLDAHGNPVTKLSTAELRKIFGTQSGSLYTRIAEACDRTKKGGGSIFDWSAVYKDPKTQTIVASQVVVDAVYKNGELYIRYNDSLAGEIMNLSRNFTVLSVKETVEMNTAYSLRLMELLKSAYSLSVYQDKGPDPRVIEYGLTELKFTIGAVTANGDTRITREIEKQYPDYEKIQEWLDERGNDKYKSSTDFQKRVIRPSIKTINEKTDLYVEYETMKSGRTVTGMRFFVYKKTAAEKVIQASAVVDSRSNDEILDELLDLMHGDFKTAEIRMFLKTADGDAERVKKAYRYFKNYPKDIDSTTGFMKSAIENNYEAPKSQKATHKWVNYTEREYSDDDFEDIEEKLQNRNRQESFNIDIASERTNIRTNLES